MATYREIQTYVRQNSQFVPQTCWIAHVMSDAGLTSRMAGNRVDPPTRAKPCPPSKRPAILAALRHFGMIPSN